MLTCIKIHLFSNKLISAVVAGVFVMTAFACFTMPTGEMHVGSMNEVCEIVIDLANNTIIQTGVLLLIVLAASWLGTGTWIFHTQSELNLRLNGLYDPPLYRQILSREYSYLSQLFSSGIIHSKLYSIAA